jgi:KDO2-lipid IV(A) lauroyltransferase
MVLPHSGNWDAAGAWCGLTGVPFTTVAERLKPESLYERFVAFRESLGMEVLPLTGGERPPYEVLAERLEAGGTICLLADRDLTPRGVDVTFFGATARMPAGPARLALATGANLMPTTLSFVGDSEWEIRFHDYVPPTDLATMAQAVASAFEGAIAQHPADWHMLQKLWLDDLDDGDPRKAAQA